MVDGPAREKMLAGLAGVKASLQGEMQDQRHPADRAAEAVMAQLGAGWMSKTG
jgi:hypothetical protein